MIADINIRLFEDAWPKLKIVITVQGEQPRTVIADWDKFSATAEPAVQNVVRYEVDKMIKRRMGK